MHIMNFHNNHNVYVLIEANDKAFAIFSISCWFNMLSLDFVLTP